MHIKDFPIAQAIMFSSIYSYYLLLAELCTNTLLSTRTPQGRLYWRALHKHINICIHTKKCIAHCIIFIRAIIAVIIRLQLSSSVCHSY